MKGTAVDKICDAMLTLLDEKPLSEISVKELTAEADVNRSSYSYHFYAKEDVLDAIYRRFNTGLGTIFFRSFSVGSEPEEIMFELRKLVFTYWYERRDEVRILRKAGYGAQFVQRFSLALEEMFHQLVFEMDDWEGNTREMGDGDLYDMFIKRTVYGILADLDFWAGYGYRIPVEELASLSCSADGLRMRNVRFKDRRHGG